jgi:hypothetical protein
MGNRFREKPAEAVQEKLVATEVAKRESMTEAEQETTESTPEPRKGKRAARGLGRVLGGDILADKLVLRQIPLLLLCLIYLLLIIGNRYHIESLSHEKQASEERINYLREQRIQMQKQYQQSVKISQIAEDLKETGVGITAGPPYEIER